MRFIASAPLVSEVWHEAPEEDNTFSLFFRALPLQNLFFRVFVGFKTDKVVDFYNFVGYNKSTA